MVTRKPLPPTADPSLTPSIPPYPVTPTSPNIPSPFQLQDAHNASQSPDGSNNEENAWIGEGLEKTLANKSNEVPASLRVGAPAFTPQDSQEMLSPATNTPNPYLQRQAEGGMVDGGESSADAWGESAQRPSQPSEAPRPPAVPRDQLPLTQQFANLSVSETSTNPWQPALNEKTSSENSTAIPSIHTQDWGHDIWSQPPPARPAPTAPEEPPLIDIEEPESPAWDEDEPSPAPSPAVQDPPAGNTQENQQILEDQHAWGENRDQEPQQHAVATQYLSPEDSAQQGEGWNLIDHEPMNDGQQSGVIADGMVIERYPSEHPSPNEQPPPDLPPRRSHEQAPPQPPRPAPVTANTSTSSLSSPGAAAARRQRKETYQIKKITWHDVNAAKNPRVSPIMVQNANGPCPLLALVNALTLSTPANVETALVETLRTREQVSLGFLLDAVFDELMSGRRGDAAQELPDVSDLYSFLVTLHTGMNVNPRFFPPPPTNSPADPRNSMSHVHPAERDKAVPGTFEETREMKLYSTFSIPLIHGWLPAPDSPEYAALKRSAQSYEDAQNLMFHEEVLEEKLHREGLSLEEQATLEDISTIKAFFNTAATQLTPYGLETITTSLAPGAVAILFRNDHFSTLYRHPETLQLLQLVTDMGYAGHEEVVWESLIDVNGEKAEFFSGDFRLVGGAPSEHSPPHSRNPSQSTEGWTTIPVRNKNQPHHNQSLSSSSAYDHNAQMAHSPKTEQEDRDLALALQLQEEEEERHRSEIARRRRESQLSQQYIEQQGSGRNHIPPIPRAGGRSHNRVSSGPTHNHGDDEPRPAIPPRRPGPGGQPIGGQPIDPEAGIDAPPPSYEQAANQAAYIPPAHHPSHPSASPSAQRRPSGYSASSQSLGLSHSTSGRAGRRPTGPTLIEQIDAVGNAARRRASAQALAQQQQQQQQDERAKDCVVM